VAKYLNMMGNISVTHLHLYDLVECAGKYLPLKKYAIDTYPVIITIIGIKLLLQKKIRERRGGNGTIIRSVYYVWAVGTKQYE
jgi:hypothetical protein